MSQTSQQSVNSPNIKNNNNAAKISQRCVAFKTFYNKHFPTDGKTYNIRLPCIGLALSILSLQLFVLTIGRHWLGLYVFYIFIAACVGYELYYGLKIGDRKQYTPWITLKFFELLCTVAIIIYGGVSYIFSLLIAGLIILVPNIAITYHVFSRLYRGGRPEVDDNVYDTYDNV